MSFDSERSSYEQIANRLSKHDRVLCIVNTRKDAKEIFCRLPDEGYKIHLSRMMCPEHIKSAIDTIKNLLDKNAIPPIRVVATQLIEAGVDMDFHFSIDTCPSTVEIKVWLRKENENKLVHQSLYYIVSKIHVSVAFAGEKLRVTSDWMDKIRKTLSSNNQGAADKAEIINLTAVQDGTVLLYAKWEKTGSHSGPDFFRLCNDCQV